MKGHMRTWHSLDLGDGIDALAPTQRIQAAYGALALQTRLPDDAALFSRYDRRINVVTVYFSPSLSSLATAFQATPCAEPVNDRDFGMLAGSQLAWQLLFPAQ